MKEKIAAVMLALATVSGCAAAKTEVEEPTVIEVGEFVEAEAMPFSSLDAKMGIFPMFSESLNKDQFDIVNQQGEYETVFEFIGRSKKDEGAIEYVEGKVSELKGLYDQQPSATDKDVGIGMIKMLWKDLSRQGNSFYSLADEIVKPKDIYISRYSEPDMMPFEPGAVTLGVTDSSKTLAEFVTPAEDGKYHGDCDDFGRSLLTAYEIARDIACKSDGEFYEKMCSGLKHNQVIGVDIESHALNALISYNEDFSEAKITPFEPQLYKYKKEPIVDTFIIKDGLLYRKFLGFNSKGKFIDKERMVLFMYNSMRCYGQEWRITPPKPSSGT